MAAPPRWDVRAHQRRSALAGASSSTRLTRAVRGILGRVDERLAPVPVVAAFGDLARPVVDMVALYVGGSLATGDFHLGVSDLDLVAVTAASLDQACRDQLRRAHQMLQREDSTAAKLHCIYVPRGRASDIGAAHLTWAQGRFFERPLNGIARAELLAAGVTVFGPPPATLLPPVSPSELQAAVRAELTGYWGDAVRKRRMWLADWCVDLGLLTLPRAEAALHEGQLITKSEALGRLERFEVPADLIAEIAYRRSGQGPALSWLDRLRRARTTRHLVAAGIARLTSLPG